MKIYKSFNLIIKAALTIDKKAFRLLILIAFIVLLLFLAPYYLILFTYFKFLSNLKVFYYLLIFSQPIYLNIVLGLFTKYVYEVFSIKYSDLEELTLINKHQAFLVGLLFIPSFIIVLIIVFLVFFI